MKKTNLMTAAAFCMALLCAANSRAQEKVQELGLGFTDLKSFSLQYRWGKALKLYRISANIGASNELQKTDNLQQILQGSTVYGSYGNPQKISTPVNISSGVNFSILHLKPVTEKFGFFFGPFIGFSYSQFHEKYAAGYTTNPGSNATIMSPSSTDDNNTIRLSPSVGLAFGGYLKLTPSFWLYTEIVPNMYYAFSMSHEIAQDDWNTGNSNNTDTKSHSHTFGISNLSNSLISLTLVYHFSNKPVINQN